MFESMFKSARNEFGPALKLLGRLLVSAAIAVLVAPLQPGHAQVSGYATISGTITDPTGAVVASADITITNGDTGAKRNTVSGNAGEYAVTFLPPGHYSVTASHPGFKTTTQPGVTLTASQAAGVNITLALGDVKENVQVSSTQEMLETESAALGQVMNETSIRELPLNSRDPAEFSFIVPGGVNGAARTSAITLAGTGNGSGSGMPTEIGASIDASRMGGVYYQLDGIYNMDNYLASANPFPNADATQEFRVLSNNFSAEYGGGSTAVVSVVTKSGTNAWHGNGFEFARDQFFNASNWFSHKQDGYKRHIFGGSEGGPLRKDRQFIFGNVQISKDTLAQNGSATWVPTNAMLTNGDFSSVPVQLHDFDGTPFVNNQIPVSRFSKVALNVEKHIPKTDTNPVYSPGSSVKSTTEEFTTRYDWNPNTKSHVMGRVFYQDYNSPNVGNSANWPGCANKRTARNQNYAANWTYTFSPMLANSFSFGYDRLSSATKSCIDQSWQQLGANIASPDPNATILVSWGSTGFGWADQNVAQKRHDFDIVDQVSWNKGKNLVVAGVNVMTQYSLEQASWLADPLVNFNGSVTGSFFSDFMLGDLGNFEQGGGEYNNYASPEFVAFVDDTIKLKPNLTLEVGLRYEPWKAMQPTPTGREADWWPGHQSQVYPNAPPGLVYPGDPGVPCCGYKSAWDRLSPRIGITWQPSFLPNTSIRAAAGRFAIPYYTTFYNHVSSDPPFSPTYQLTPQTLSNVRIPIEDPWSVFAGSGGVSPFPPFAYKNGAMPAHSVGFTTPVALPAIWTPNFKLGWSQNWNLSIQHQIGRDWLVTAAYVGSEAYHITTGADVNPGIYASGGARTLYPNFQSILIYTPWGTASYEGLHLSVEKRFSNGFQFITNYAWSKSLDLLSQSDLSSGPLLRDAFHPGIDHGISVLNVPNDWSTTGIWQAPALKGRNRVLAGALGNWEISGILTMASGVPFSIQGGSGNNNSKSQNGNDLADLTGKPLNVHKGSRRQWVQQYFNPAAFQPNAPGTFGNSPKNLMKGPADDNLDTGVMKNFPFHKERYRLQFRWEMFNATNTPWFAAPDTNPTDSNFGQITGLQGDPLSSGHGNPRVMQFAAKFDW